MTIVAERAVGAQVGRSLEEEKETAVQVGPVDRRAVRRVRERVARPEREARRPAAQAVPQRRVRSSYTGGDRVDLRTREDVPLTAEQSALLGRLVERYHARLLGKARWLLEYRRDADAEDVVQETWLALSRQLDTLRDEERCYAYLVSIMRFRMLERTSNLRRREWATDDEDMVRLAGSAGDDPTGCAVAELLDGQAAAWSACYAQAVAALPERQREVLEMACVDGMGTPAIGARLGITKQSAAYHLRRAVDALRPVAGAPVEEGLPQGWERVVDRLPARQREALLLRVQGVCDRDIERRMDLTCGTVGKTLASAERSLRRMVREQAADPVPARKPCAQQCASGCYLRQARPEVTA